MSHAIRYRTTGESRHALPVLDNRADELSWMASSSCSQTDPELWFPEKGSATRPARQVCGSCPVRRECLRHALDTLPEFGIWGGHTIKEIRAMAREGRVAA